MAAVSSGDLQGLVEVLAPDVVLIADGGGLVAAARKPITGVEKVVAFLARAAKVPDIMASTAWLNGMPAARIDVGGAATAVSLVVEDGRITHGADGLTRRLASPAGRARPGRTAPDFCRCHARRGR